MTDTIVSKNSVNEKEYVDMPAAAKIDATTATITSAASLAVVADKFEDRHVGFSADNDTQTMLTALSYASMDSFIRDVVPESIYQS